MKTKNGLTQDDNSAYEEVALDLMILLGPRTTDEIQRFDYLCDHIWDALVISRRERDQ
jgi:hypothetical protein